jgi:hypothetical protein
MRGLVVVSLALTLAGGMLLGMSTLVGRAIGQPPHAIGDMGDCGLPCWRAITPRVSQEAAAEAVLRERGYREVAAIRMRLSVGVFIPEASADCAARLSYRAGIVADIALTGCPDVRLGDLMAVLGAPDGLIAGNILSFSGGTLFAAVRASPCEGGLSPFDDVENIFIAYYNAASGPERVLANLHTWHGFASTARYQRLEPNLLQCG